MTLSVASSTSVASQERLRIPLAGGRHLRWGWLVAMLVAIYLLRGIALGCVIPPLEMWDEYQHIAYMQFLVEHDETPVLRKAFVSKTLVQNLVKLPQCEDALQQVPKSGAVGYEQYWASGGKTTFNTDSNPPWLYEAQHPPAYYRLMLPIYKLTGGAANLKTTVCVLRLFNVAFTAIGLTAVLIWLGFVCQRRAFAAILGLAVVMQPLFLLNACRVANDALAVGIGCVAVVWCMSIKNRWIPLQAIGIGALVGAGVLVKTTDTAILPFALLCLFLLFIGRQITVVNWLLSSVLMTAAFAAVTFQYFQHNLQIYHLLVPMQEAVDARDMHAGWPEYKANLPLTLPQVMEWKDIYLKKWIDENIWTGGWSFNKLPDEFLHAYTWVIKISLLGWIVAWIFRRVALRLPDVFKHPWVGIRILFLFAIVTAGMCYHSMYSKIAFRGAVATMAWYGAVAFAWYLIGLISSSLAFRHTRLGRLAFFPALFLPMLFLAAEGYGVLEIMLPTYGCLIKPFENLHRLATLHPAAMGTPTLILAALLALVLFLVAYLSTAHTLLFCRPDTVEINSGVNPHNVVIPGPAIG